MPYWAAWAVGKMLRAWWLVIRVMQAVWDDPVATYGVFLAVIVLCAAVAVVG
jgi:hypothetical protein